jgi:hypothetical protein
VKERERERGREREREREREKEREREMQTNISIHPSDLKKLSFDLLSINRLASTFLQTVVYSSPFRLELEREK